VSREKLLTLCVFIDAFGWQLVRHYPFMDDVLVTKSPLGTIFGYSSTCDPTILTGKLPREHGHFAFYYYNPPESPFKFYRVLDLLPKTFLSRGRVRARLSRVMGRFHGYTGYFQLYNMPFKYLHLFDYSERRDIYQPGGINSGARTVFDVLRERQVPSSVSDWRLPELARCAELSRELDRGRIRFAFLFLGGLDAVLHVYGTQAEEVAQHLRVYERELSKLVERAQSSYSSVDLFIFSDHGMTDVSEKIDLIPRIQALGLRFGVDYAAVYDSTMARFWFLKDNARELISEALDEIPQGRIVPDAQLAEWGCDFPGHKYGELFFLLNPGVLLCPSYMGEKPLAAMHGYTPEHPSSVAAFMSSVPCDPAPGRLDDLYGLVVSEATREPEEP
jgi:hypothetical protein